MESVRSVQSGGKVRQIRPARDIYHEKRISLAYESIIRFYRGETSPRAIKIGANWLKGKLAAKTLHDALPACGIAPLQQRFINIFGDNPGAPSVEIVSRIRLIRALSKKGYRIVALGNKVSRILTRNGVEHTHLIHPAARGAIRLRERYQAHVAERLTGELARLSSSVCD